jgi:hypothetical protein
MPLPALKDICYIFHVVMILVFYDELMGLG